MKTIKIALRPESSVEAVLSMGPTISALKTIYPQSEVGMVASPTFQEASALVPGLDFFLSEDNSETVDHLYDFSNSSEESEGQESRDWKAYKQGAASDMDFNPFHLIDLLKKIGRAEAVYTEFMLLPPNREFQLSQEYLAKKDSLRIALCASSMGIDSLQATMEALASLEFSVSIHLVGTIADKKKSSILVSAWNEKIEIGDFCGKTSLSERAELFRTCDIAITGPGPSAILSSGYGTFTICIDENRSPLHYPYGHGHLIIQKTESEEFYRACSRLMKDLVAFAVNGNEGNIPTIEQWQSFCDARIDQYLSKIRLLATQRLEILSDDGSSLTELYLRPLLFMGYETSDVFQRFYRLLWEHSLNKRVFGIPKLDVLHPNSLNSLVTNLKPMQKVYELANFGRIYSEYIQKHLSTGDLKRANQDSAKLQETESLLYELGKIFAALAPLCAFHEKRQQLFPLDSAISLAKNMSDEFSSLQERLVVLLDLAQTLFHNTLEIESPLANKPSGEERADG